MHVLIIAGVVAYFLGNIRIGVKYANDKTEFIFFFFLGMPVTLLSSAIERWNNWMYPGEYWR